MKILYFEEHTKHNLKSHPENSERIEGILDLLKDLAPVKKVKPEKNEEYIKKHHVYWEKIKNLCERMKEGEYRYLDPDTYLVKGTYEAAVAAVNLPFQAIEFDEKHVICLTRPPGHHASTHRWGGFCIFNNVGILAREIGENFDKILILDLDYHHGNGTQEMILDARNVIYISIHRFGVYPGTGFYTERGKGNIYNIPLDFSSVSDKEYWYVFQRIIIPIFQKYSPDIVLISLGFDTYKYDPLGDWNLSKVWSAIYCFLREYRTISLLEGGYRPLNIFFGLKEVMKGIEGKKSELEGEIREDFKKYINDLSSYFLKAI